MGRPEQSPSAERTARWTRANAVERCVVAPTRLKIETKFMHVTVIAQMWLPLIYETNWDVGFASLRASLVSLLVLRLWAPCPPAS